MARAEVAAERAGTSRVEVVCGSIGTWPRGALRRDPVVGVLEYSAAAIGGEVGRPPGVGAPPPGPASWSSRSRTSWASSPSWAAWRAIGASPGSGSRTIRVRPAAHMEPAGTVHGAPAAPVRRPAVAGSVPRLQAPVGHPRRGHLPAAGPRVAVEQLVLRPVVFLDAYRSFGDAAAAHRVFVGAGIGLDLASSFLVVATPDDGAPRLASPGDRLAWLFGGIAARSGGACGCGPDEQLLRDGDGKDGPSPGSGRTLATTAPSPSVEPWARSQDALRAHDLDALKVVLRRWWAELVRRSTAAPAAAESRGRRTRSSYHGNSCTAADHLDASSSNFVTSGGGLVLSTTSGRQRAVEMEMSAAPALWMVGQEIIMLGHTPSMGPQNHARGGIRPGLVAMVPFEV